MTENAKKIIYTIISAAFWIALWFVAAAIVAKEVILPSPVVVFQKIGELAATGGFWLTIGRSLLRVTLGVVGAAALGLLAADAAHKFAAVRAILRPLNEVVKATPIVSFIFIAYIAFNKTITVLPVFIAALIVFPVIYGQVLAALDGVGRELFEVAEVFDYSKDEKLKSIWLPTILPVFSASFATSIGLGWKAGIAAEALAASSALVGIGTEISNAKTFIETVDQFAWTTVIIILSVIIELLFKFAINKIKKKYE